jgi:uncharacterized membrane protein YhfC
MKRAFYIFAATLAIAWMLTFFVFHAGRGVHALILMAVICWLHAIITIPQKRYMLGNIKQNRLSEEENAEEQRA